MVLEILSVDKSTKEVSNPIEVNIHSGEIEFKNVSFSYDQSFKKED